MRPALKIYDQNSFERSDLNGDMILHERGVAKYADRFQRSLTIFGRGRVYQPQKKHDPFDSGLLSFPCVAFLVHLGRNRGQGFPSLARHLANQTTPNASNPAAAHERTMAGSTWLSDRRKGPIVELSIRLDCRAKGGWR